MVTRDIMALASIMQQRADQSVTDTERKACMRRADELRRQHRATSSAQYYSEVNV